MEPFGDTDTNNPVVVSASVITTSLISQLYGSFFESYCVKVMGVDKDCVFGGPWRVLPIVTVPVKVVLIGVMIADRHILVNKLNDILSK